MPRSARKKSETGIYHIMLRGINRQSIFEEDEDYLQLIQKLNKYNSKHIHGSLNYLSPVEYCLA